MHFLAATQGQFDIGEQALDLKQRPADVVFLSAADSELSVLSKAYRRMAQRRACDFSLRIANLRMLQHPASLDLYIEKTLCHARLIVARLLGGAQYFPYFCQEVQALCRARAIDLVLLSGESHFDEGLREASTLPRQTTEGMFAYWLYGGIDNAEAFLQLVAQSLGLMPSPQSLPRPRPLPEASLYLHRNKRLQTLFHGAPQQGDSQAWQAFWQNLRVPLPEKTAVLLFYRALLQSDNVKPVEALVQACARHRIALLPIAVSSLKSAVVQSLLQGVLRGFSTQIFFNATGFALGGVGLDPLAEFECPVLQVAFSSASRSEWKARSQGLSASDLAMQVVLPETDGRIFTRALAFKRRLPFDANTQSAPLVLVAEPSRCRWVAALADNWLRLQTLANKDKRLAIVLHNYPPRDGRLANGVGLDTPRALATILLLLREAGYDLSAEQSARIFSLEDRDQQAQAWIDWLASGPTNAVPQRAHTDNVEQAACLSDSDYQQHFDRLDGKVRKAVERVWGAFRQDPFFHKARGAFVLPVVTIGNIAVCLQCTRGYDRNPEAIVHDPNLPPPHAYLALYFWITHAWDSAALLHLGKHGTAEWLPGKSVALSAACACEAVAGTLPHFYPFIVNDPGEGTQAKRRAHAVILDHLPPPLGRATLHGDAARIEFLLDEYAQARALHKTRAQALAVEIIDLGTRSGLFEECGLSPERCEQWSDASLALLDSHICTLKELQIRNGLHRFGEGQEPAARVESLCALLRIPRGTGAGEESLLRALAKDFGWEDYDPLDHESYGRVWRGGECPTILRCYQSQGSFRHHGGVTAVLEAYTLALVGGSVSVPSSFVHTRAVLGECARRIAPLWDGCAGAEASAILTALQGRAIAPGPSGAPTRGRIDVLPTGRNFHSVDVRAVPSAAAWQLGWRSASLLVERFFEEHGAYPRTMALSAWATSCMRTAGEDVAQMLALMGVRPTWGHSGRVEAFEIMPLSVLGRPRVDVMLRISGMFRDAFSRVIDLIDKAVHAVAALPESDEDNPLAAAVKKDRETLGEDAISRIFGAQQGGYGTGLNVPIDSGAWTSEKDLAEVFLHASQYAYRSDSAHAARPALERRLSGLDAVVHNQDNREHDILDSDDYYQFEGGLALAARVLSGKNPPIYHNDHSRVFAPRIARLDDEIARIVRARATNPKWINAVMKHGYKGASEIAATLDYLFAFAATARVVHDRHFDMLFTAYLEDERVRAFLARVNPEALSEICARFQEARRRGLWTTQRNDIPEKLDGYGKDVALAKKSVACSKRNL